MKKKAYIVGNLIEGGKIKVATNTVNGSSVMIDVSLEGYYDGVIGFLPVFRNKKKAQKIAGRKFPIIEGYA